MWRDSDGLAESPWRRAHLAAGDPLGALKRVALGDDAPAVALRAVAVAQLGDFDRAQGASLRLWARSLRRGPTPRDDHRDVVVLLVRTEPPDLVDERVEQRSCGQVAAPA
jgi:hypothetical protein